MSEVNQDVTNLDVIPLEDIKIAAKTIKGKVIRTPLVPLNMDHRIKQIYLKLENFQQSHTFKVRGITNMMSRLPKNHLGSDGVYTSSSGSFATSLAWEAHHMKVPCKVIAPDNITPTKLESLRKLNADVIKVPYPTFWQVMEDHKYEGMKGRFFHPGVGKDMIAGNGTIGLEILEDLPDVDTIICPYGTGGCVTGVASVMKALKPDVKMIACEVSTAAPLAASLAVGKPVKLSDHRISFVDGMGGMSVLPQMWKLVSNLVDESIVLSPGKIAHAIQLLLESNCMVAEGAGAAPVAAALDERVETGKIVCIISGGNIHKAHLAQVINGKVPE